MHASAVIELRKRRLKLAQLIGFAGPHYCCTPPLAERAMFSTNMTLPHGL